VVGHSLDGEQNTFSPVVLKEKLLMLVCLCFAPHIERFVMVLGDTEV
jgi:hypothetical protein